jgi:hypothetical protein
MQIMNFILQSKEAIDFSPSFHSVTYRGAKKDLEKYKI